MIEEVLLATSKGLRPQSVAQGEKGNFTQALQKALRKEGNSFDSIFQEAGEKWGLPPALLKAVALVESNLNPRAVSRAGAQGLMQLMPSTALSLGVKNPFDPRENIFGGARYLRSLLDRFGGDVRLALAAYNAGPGTVEKYNGVPPFPETQKYLQRVLETARNTASLNGSLEAAEEMPTTRRPAGARSRQDAAAGIATAEVSPEWVRIWAALLLAEAALAAGSSNETAD